MYCTGRKSINVLPPLKQKVAPSHPANHELQGYMPGRMEFEHEAENEAEHIVKDMSFNEDDDQVETGERIILSWKYNVSTDLKLAVMDIYNSRLDVREERRRFIFGRNLIEFKKVTEQSSLISSHLINSCKQQRGKSQRKKGT